MKLYTKKPKIIPPNEKDNDLYQRQKYSVNQENNLKKRSRNNLADLSSYDLEKELHKIKSKSKYIKKNLNNSF